LAVSVIALVIAVLQLRQASRSGGSVAPQVRREQHALDRLRVHLGRQAGLPRMGDLAIQALALRVHPAIDLPSSTPPAKPAEGPSQPSVAGWRQLVRRWSRSAHQRSRLDRDLPVFVDRDQGPDLRAWLEAARTTGGFLILSVTHRWEESSAVRDRPPGPGRLCGLGARSWRRGTGQPARGRHLPAAPAAGVAG
jgi:hypothetical protein